MSAGLPVVATDIGGSSEVVEHERTGLLVPPGNSIALAQAIQRLVSDTSLAQRLASAGGAYVRLEHSEARMLLRLEQTYVELVGNKPARAGN